MHPTLLRLQDDMFCWVATGYFELRLEPDCLGPLFQELQYPLEVPAGILDHGVGFRFAPKVGGARDCQHLQLGTVLHCEIQSQFEGLARCSGTIVGKQDFVEHGALLGIRLFLGLQQTAWEQQSIGTE